MNSTELALFDQVEQPQGQRRRQIGYQAVYIEAMGTLIEAVSGDGGDRAAVGTAAGEFARKYVLTGGASSLVRADISLDDIAKKAAAGIDRAQGQVNAIRFEADYASEVLANMREDAKAQGWGSAGGYYLELAKVAQARLDAARRPFPQPAEESVGKNTVNVQPRRLEVHPGGVQPIDIVLVNKPF